MALELGITTFAETTPNQETGVTTAHDVRIREILAEATLADKLGLDVYGIGEHHRPDYAASSPEMILAAAAAVTENIKLTSAVTVLSSDDPVRVYQRFATLDALSNGRAEIMAGRGSFIESFPLFGYGLENYNELFDEKLELLLKVRAHEVLSWQGEFREPITNAGVYPRSKELLPVVVGTGGNPESTIRAARLGLPISYAIIGGNPQNFGPLIQLYKRTAIEAGHDLAKMQISSHSHGYIAESNETAIKEFFPSTQYAMNVLGRERGWGHYDLRAFEAAASPDGALFVGDPETVAKKIIRLHRELGIQRFLMHTPIGSMDHEKVLKSIELFATKVAPIVRRELANDK